MTKRVPRTRRAVAFVLLAALAGAACGSAGQHAGVAAGTCGTSEVTAPCSDLVVARGVAFVRAHRTDIDEASLMFFAYFARRWHVDGLGDFAAQAQRQERAARGTDAFARLVDGSHVSASVIASQRGLNALTVPLLECSRVAPDSRVVARLDAAIARGGYDATHVLLGLMWAREQGCAVASAARIGRAVASVAADLRPVDHFTDLAAEQAAFLTYAGHAASVPTRWTEIVVTAQRLEGGWPSDSAGTEVARHGDADPSRPNWHSTGLALWWLLAHSHPNAPDPGMVPR
jgi:hypothetical protein